MRGMRGSERTTGSSAQAPMGVNNLVHRSVLDPHEIQSCSAALAGSCRGRKKSMARLLS
jgi:hypothetical protein